MWLLLKKPVRGLVTSASMDRSMTTGTLAESDSERRFCSRSASTNSSRVAETLLAQYHSPTVIPRITFRTPPTTLKATICA